MRKLLKMDSTLILHTPHIYDVIFSALSPDNLIQCSRTSRDMYDATNNFKRRAFDISKHLMLFFRDVTGFRKLQRRTGAVISGSNALQFMDRYCIALEAHV